MKPNLFPSGLLLLLLLFPAYFFAQSPTSGDCPCCTEQHKQFDFWEGNWETFKTGTDTLLGTNHILKLQDQCILQENWAAAKGKYTGTSYNWWDGTHWNQSWIDNQGGSLKLSGNWRGTKMVLESEEMTGQQGKPYFNRITWTPAEDGSVRQLWQVSTDQKKTWKTLFDGTYKKKM